LGQACLFFDASQRSLTCNVTAYTMIDARHTRTFVCFTLCFATYALSLRFRRCSDADNYAYRHSCGYLDVLTTPVHYQKSSAWIEAEP
jgi:hypothetical protein